MKLWKFEGTAEELQAARFLLTDSVPRDAEGNPSAQVQLTTPTLAESEETAELTEQAAVAFLTRRPLAETQAAVVKALLNATDGFKTSELAKLIGCSVDAVKGSMRSFGKRVAHTTGWPPGLEAFDRKWLGSENVYRLHPTVRAVLESGRVKL